jgi:pimeloyl-ACP methyl ester carboxylesterase
MQPLAELDMEVGGVATRALALEGDGPGLILLHGWGDSADTWRPLLARLARIGRRAIAVDMPGFGAASELGTGALLPQFDAFAAALVKIWSGPTRRRDVVVVGNSLGGVTALRLAERADLPLAGVVPVAPAGLDMPRWLDVVERDPILRRLLDLGIPIPRPVAAAAVGQLYRRLAFSGPRAADPEAVRTYAGYHASREGMARLLASGRRLLAELATPPFDFAAIACPVLLVWGTRDHMVPHRGARVLIDAVPSARLELIDGCGHCPQLEAPGVLLDLLAGFPVPAALAAAAA